MSPGRQGGSVPFPNNTSGPTLHAPVLTMGIVTDVASMSAALPVNSLPCIAPQSSNWEVYTSTDYHADPTSDAEDWSAPINPDGDGPLNADWTEMPHGSYFICRCRTSAGWSTWSNIIPGPINVTVNQQTGSLGFTWSGTNPTGWSLAVFYDEENWANSNASNYGDLEDDNLTAPPTSRGIDVSSEATPFYFILVANGYSNGADVEAARGQFSLS